MEVKTTGRIKARKPHLNHRGKEKMCFLKYNLGNITDVWNRGHVPSDCAKPSFRKMETFACETGALAGGDSKQQLYREKFIK
jgi:hypothetical protein